MTVKTNFDEWAAQFNKQATLALNVSEKTFYKACDILFNNIKIRTPVGNPGLWKYPAPKNYVPGTLKASWTIQKSQNFVRIENDQPYAERVEYGWSTQAPEGMVRISIKEYPQIVDQVAKEYKI